MTGSARRPAVGCSVGIMAYNEEANIADAIESILEADSLPRGRVTELIVVASGCEDRTAEIVAELARHDPRVRLIRQERREGKASAINLFIGEARSPVLIMVSADVLVKQGTIESLLAHFDDPAVGMVGGHPTPVNDEATFMGHAVHLQWRLHDRIARQSPKLGEIVAFRNVVPKHSARHRRGRALHPGPGRPISAIGWCTSLRRSSTTAARQRSATFCGSAGAYTPDICASGTSRATALRR